MQFTTSRAQVVTGRGASNRRVRVPLKRSRHRERMVTPFQNSVVCIHAANECPALIVGTYFPPPLRQATRV